MGDAMRAVLKHVAHVAHATSEREAVDQVLKTLSRTELSSGVLQKATIESAIERGLAEGTIEAVERGARAMDVDADEDDEGEAMTETAAAMVHNDGLTICDAFKTKRYAYDSQRRMFDEASKTAKIESDAESKIDLYRDRFLLLQQRLSRSRQFAKPTLQTSSTEGIAELTSIQSLLGVSKETKFIMGCLSNWRTNGFTWRI